MTKRCNPTDLRPVPGDSNDDGQVNVGDIVLAQRHVLGLITLSPSQITLQDLLIIQKISLSLP